MNAASIAVRRSHLATSLRDLADKLDTATDNHLASILGFEIGATTRNLAELYAAVEAQRAVAFFARNSKTDNR